MSKKSRTFQPSEPRPANPDASGGSSPAPTSGTPAPSGTSPTTPPKSTSGGASRAEARRRSSAPKASAQPSFFERYRVLIVGGAGVVVVILALLFFNRSTSGAYECVTFLTPPPAAAPAGSGDPASSSAPASPAPSEAPAASAPAASAPAASTPAASTPAASGPAASAPVASAAPTPTPGPTPLLGFPTSDMGKEHKTQGTNVRYDYCPPASGSHYNLGNGQAPLARRFYTPDISLLPQQWIHNLEHGYVVVLYKGDPGTEALDELRRVMDDASPSTWNLTNCGASVPNKVVVVRFDDMDPGVNFAAVAWDRALLQGELNADDLLAFAEQWQDGPQTPERICG